LKISHLPDLLQGIGLVIQKGSGFCAFVLLKSTTKKAKQPLYYQKAALP
jgi:hypothetical protein